MKLSTVRQFPTRIPHWETLNDLARSMHLLGATKPEKALPVGTLKASIPGTDKNAYRVLREAVGFAPVRDDASGSLRYYYEAEELAELFADELGTNFYPKSFASAYKLTNEDLSPAEKVVTIHKDGTLFRIRPMSKFRQLEDLVMAMPQAKTLQEAQAILDELISWTLTNYEYTKTQMEVKDNA